MAQLGRTAVLEVRGLTVQLGSGKEAKVVVNGVGFEIDEGELLGIVGASGSGKTTVLRSILRRLPRTAQILSGSIRYRSAEVLTMSESDLRRIRGARISIIVQNPIGALNPLRRVRDQMVGACRQHGRRISPERLASGLRDVGIADPDRVMRAYPHELSGGLAQRVLIAAAVLLEPDLILADEPSSSLDVTIQAQIMELLRDLVKERGLALILVTHDIALVADYCDHVLVMKEGRVVEHGTVEQVVHDPRQAYTKELIDAARPARAAADGTGNRRRDW